jgi:signal transduction histidine kinase
MNDGLIRVLLVEGDPKFARMLRESLSGLTGSGILAFLSGTLAETLTVLKHEKYHALLLNPLLSDSKGISTFLRVQAAVPNVPIVILTCHENEALALQAVRQGAQDYLVKSKVDGKILARVIRYAIERKRTEMSIVATNAELLQINHELTRSEEALRRALDELRASHEELKAAQLQLIQAEKMECVGTLAAGVAHEVKNPLQTILMGVAYLSKNIVVSDPNTSLVLTDIRDAVKRADAIVRDLLYLSSARQIEMKEENINAVLEHSLCFVNYDLTRSRVLVIRELANDLPTARVDRAKIEQVFINLFMNAIHAMPEGGKLYLRTRALDEGALRSDLPGINRFQSDDHIVMIDIEDTGCGVPKEKLSRIFEPFFTTKPNGVGTGLGLPVSKQIVDLHGGVISIRPGSNGGTKVTLVLKSEPESKHEKETNSADWR